MKLEKEFQNIRNESYTNYNLNYKYLNDIEKKERKIIKNINFNNKKCEFLFRKLADLDKQEKLYKNFKNFKIPKVNFKRIVKKKVKELFNENDKISKLSEESKITSSINSKSIDGIQRLYLTDTNFY